MLGLLGATGAGFAAAPALQVLNFPLLGLTALFLGRGWYLQLTHGDATVWQRRARGILFLSTVTSIALWTIRFSGLLGMRPF